MAASITLSLQKSLATGEPVVVATVIAATNIAGAVFVYRSEDGAYSHLASTRDLRTLTTSGTGAAFYRATTVTRRCASVQEAEDYATFVRTHLRRLVKDWDAENAFEATVEETYTT